jgi:enoyl-CoA hydratase/carnithine racemase
VKIAREGALLRVTLDRPDEKNVLNGDDCASLAECVNDAEAGAVLIESTGPVFCGGMGEDCDPGALFSAETWRGLPVIAAVQGPAVDEGVALIACAHIVVASQGASFALTSIRRGVFPRVTFQALERAIGERRALELSLTGRVFTVNNALSWGLVHVSAPAFEFDDRAEAIAAALAPRQMTIRTIVRRPGTA